MRHLQVLVKVAELGSVKRAAEAIGLTQPSTTQALADLEQLLECTLFDRHARGMHPTPIALAVLPLARRMLDALNDCAEAVVAFSAEGRSLVRIAALSGAVTGILAKALPVFSQQHPDILLQIQEADIEQIGALMAGGGLDMVFCRQPPVATEGWRFEPLLDDEFVVIAAPHHPLAGRKRLTFKALRDEIWLTSPVASAPRRTLDQWSAAQGIEPRQRLISTRSMAIVWAALVHERCVCLVPLSIASQLLDAGQLVRLNIAVPYAFEPIGMMTPIDSSGLATQKLQAFLLSFEKAR
nr:LysR family transcriptional regulator [Variovorax terrae]